ncbi:MAG: head GIN domain-containing protein [Candidatus Hinthialibacter antarcticus]|nr:head GIN domain-containing protein [Candidatus Hinthialibacter antarcticus]
MMNRNLLIGTIAVIVGMIGACDIDDYSSQKRIYGSGDAAVEERDVSGSFQRVSLRTVGEMTLQLGPRTEVVVEGDDNILPYIHTEIENGELQIYKERGVNLRPSVKLRYTVTTPDLEAIALSSSGKAVAPFIETDSFEIKVSSSGGLKMDGLKTQKAYIKVSSSGGVLLGSLNADRVETNISSSGDIHIEEGRVDRLDVKCSSSGNFKAADVMFQDVVAHCSSSGGAWVHVSESLKADCSSSGGVYYRGNPSVEAHTSSSGRVKRM